MANQITVDGLETKTKSELIAELKAGFQSIYGADINVDSDTPDGQLIDIFAQAAIDNLDLLVQIYNTFNPDAAIGRVLDARCALNGISRLGGTYSYTNITVVTDRALNLVGLDGDIDNPDGVGYTVSDNAGNEFILAASQSVGAAGSHVYSFRAKNNGALLTSPNTITVPVDIVLGVSSVNNPSVQTVIGIDEETDAKLRIRRQKSVAISSKGYLNGLLAALLNINEVSSAYVYENNTGSTDGDGIPGHSIWVIVSGGSDADVGAAIYAKRNAGVGMKGSETVDITQVDGTVFEVAFDRVATEDLFIEFDVSSINGIDTPDIADIADQLVLLLVPGVNEGVNINELATIVQTIDPNALVTNAGFSNSGSGPFTNTLLPSSKNLQFALDAGNIDITVV